MKKIQNILQNYGINGEVIGSKDGPLLQIIEFKPASGTKIRQILAIEEDIRREMSVSSLRIEALPESSSIAFEIPLKTPQTVDFPTMISSDIFQTASNKMALPLLMGVNTRGEPNVADLAKMPHLLVAGTTGSGKSVGLNAFILSLMSARTPQELKFVLIDPKKIEFSTYNNQKYLYAPVITESDEAVAMLSYLADEMDKRYEMFAQSASRNISAYNKVADTALPYIVCVIDEFADLMATNKEAEKNVIRLAQKARASGIHLILATQRPSVDVVTGVLKANFPARLAFKTASSTDSRTILDTNGAENLIGRGDCLFLAADGAFNRLHGAYADDTYIENALKPYRCKIKPIKGIEQKTTETQEFSTKTSSKTSSKPNIFIRCWRFWSNLRVRDRKLIINFIKSTFLFILSITSKRKK